MGRGDATVHAVHGWMDFSCYVNRRGGEEVGSSQEKLEGREEEEVGSRQEILEEERRRRRGAVRRN